MPRASEGREDHSTPPPSGALFDRILARRRARAGTPGTGPRCMECFGPEARYEYEGLRLCRDCCGDYIAELGASLEVLPTVPETPRDRRKRWTLPISGVNTSLKDVTVLGRGNFATHAGLAMIQKRSIGV